MNGRLVKEVSVDGRMQFRLGTSSLAEGVYVLSADTPGQYPVRLKIIRK